jgi:hypothetical protein
MILAILLACLLRDRNSLSNPFSLHLVFRIFEDALEGAVGGSQASVDHLPIDSFEISREKNRNPRFHESFTANIYKVGSEKSGRQSIHHKQPIHPPEWEALG